LARPISDNSVNGVLGLGVFRQNKI
jgi:hypothetical protein